MILQESMEYSVPKLKQEPKKLRRTLKLIFTLKPFAEPRELKLWFLLLQRGMKHRRI